MTIDAKHINELKSLTRNHYVVASNFNYAIYNIYTGTFDVVIMKHVVRQSIAIDPKFSDMVAALMTTTTKFAVYPRQIIFYARGQVWTYAHAQSNQPASLVAVNPIPDIAHDKFTDEEYTFTFDACMYSTLIQRNRFLIFYHYAQSIFPLNPFVFIQFPDDYIVHSVAMPYQITMLIRNVHTQKLYYGVLYDSEDLVISFIECPSRECTLACVPYIIHNMNGDEVDMITGDGSEKIEITAQSIIKF